MTTRLDIREAEDSQPISELPVESEHHKRYGRGTLRLLAPVLSRRNLFGIWAGVVLAVIAMGLIGLIPLIQQVILDDAIVEHRRSLPLWLGIMVATGLASFVANYLRRSVGGRAAVRAQRDLQVRVHRHMQYLDASRRDELRAGDIMSRATCDLTLIQMFLQQLGVAYGNVALLIVSLVVMVVLSPLLALIMVVSVPTFLLVAMRFRSGSFPASWMDQRFRGSVAGVVEEAVTGVRVVKAFGQESQEQDALHAEAGKLFQSRLRTARITAVYSAALDAIPGLTQLAVLALGGWLVMEGRVSLGVFLAFGSYILQLVAPVRFLSGLMATSQQARAGAQRIVELLSIQSRVQERPDPVVLTAPAGLVELDNVDFGYPGGEPILHDICLRIAPGEKIAIVGASGSGKSTLAHLLARFHDPTAGTVRLDGRDIRDYSLTSLRAAVGIVFEEGFLFSTTIRDNIAFGRPDATDDDVEHAAVAAHAHGFVAGLPEGYGTLVGERGFTLSGGQRQRLALARAALTNPTVLILDDATSAIDARTEHAVHRSLEEVLARRTTVLIAHRHSTLMLADRVIVLDRGRIVDTGTTEELLGRSALFRELLTGPDAESADETAPEAPVTDLDPAAWPHGVSRLGAPKMSSFTSEAATRASSGSHGPGMSGDASTLAGLASVSPKLLDAVEALPPLRGEPDIDMAHAMAPVRELTMTSVFRPFSRPLVLAGILVVVDGMLWISAPILIRFGLDHGVLKNSHRALAAVCLVLAAVQVLIWINTRVMVVFTQRTAERMLVGLRVRTFAHLQRLALNYYEQYMAGHIMTRMTSDVEAFAQLLQQGLLTAMVSLLSCAGVAVALAIFDPQLALATAVVLPFLIASTLWFRRESGRTYLLARERVSVLYGNMQESLAGVAVSQAYCQQPANEARFAVLADDYCTARVRSAELMARFYDATSGTVLIDGLPIKQLDLVAYRRQLGYVPQEPFLFSGTIRSNIAYGNPDAPDLVVEQAARAVGAHAFIAELPWGYHTPVSEQGRSLSAGQRQLLGLARALLVDPRILLLDEATANLDLATEAQVQRAMAQVSRGRTTIVIAHRLQTARAAQRVLVVDNGLIVEDGSHHELLALGGRYAALCQQRAPPRDPQARIGLSAGVRPSARHTR